MWRSTLGFAYDSWLNQNPQWVATSANVRLWNGTGGSGVQGVDVYWASALDYNGLVGGGYVSGSHLEYDGDACQQNPPSNPGPPCAGASNVIERYGPWLSSNTAAVCWG